MVVAGASISVLVPAQVKHATVSAGARKIASGTHLSAALLLHAQLAETTNTVATRNWAGTPLACWLMCGCNPSDSAQRGGRSSNGCSCSFSAAVCPDYHQAGVHKAAVAVRCPSISAKALNHSRAGLMDVALALRTQLFDQRARAVPTRRLGERGHPSFQHGVFRSQAHQHAPSPDSA